MSIYPYIDGNGLISNTVVPPGTQRASDNGPLFSAQYLMVGEALTLISLADNLANCVREGKVYRTPDDTTPDAPDDYYGVLSWSVFSGLDYSIRLEPRLWHPALVYLNLRASGNPLYLLLSPLVATIIALSNLGSPKEDTSNRMLTWTIGQALLRRGAITKLAYHFWEYRQRKIYGNISAIAGIYFGPDHPTTLSIIAQEQS